MLFGCPPGFLGQGTVQGVEGLGHALDEYGWVDEPVGHDLEDLSGQIGGGCAPWFLLGCIATWLSTDACFASEFDEKLRGVIRKYLCHGDGYKFPIGLELIKPMNLVVRAEEWIPDED